MEAARAAPGHVLSLSLEVPAEGVEYTLHWAPPAERPGAPDPGLVSEVFRPGEPWLTGIVQIDVPGEASAALVHADVTRWVRGPDGSMGSQHHEGGLAPDPDLPELQFDGGPDTWPPLPEHWR